MPFSASLQDMRDRAPGVVMSITIAMAATFLSEHHGGPTLLYALLVGIAFHFLSREGAAAAGIAFTARTILRLGVAMLGVRISAGQITELGFVPIASVVAGVIGTMVLGRLLATFLGLSASQGLLTGGAVGICGASAALAISAVLPKSATRERDTLFTVISVTVLSTVAMVLYPLIARALGFDGRASGILIGGTIHDVAQVVGAGYMISDQAGIVATYVKLLRVAMLLPVVVALSWIFIVRDDGASSSRTQLLPTFLVGFAVLAAMNSAGLVPTSVADTMAAASRWCLVSAIAALGMKTSLEELTTVGWRSIALVVAETVFLLLLVVLILVWHGHR